METHKGKCGISQSSLAIDPLPSHTLLWELWCSLHVLWAHANSMPFQLHLVSKAGDSIDRATSLARREWKEQSSLQVFM